MKTTCKLDRTFGPVGTSAGIFLLIGGILMIWFSLSGIIVALIGAFIGFTYTSTIIDHERRMIKHSTNIFGVLKTGTWITLEPSMKIGLKKSTTAWKAYSRSNVTLNISNRDYRIMLYDSNNKQIIPIKKANSLESAKNELEILSNELSLNLLTNN